MSDTFNANGDTVELIVNGSSQGQVSTRGATVGNFVTDQAKRHGLKSFSVYVDGRKFYTEQAGDRLEPGVKVEIVAKDSRGFVMVPTHPIPEPMPTPTPQPDNDPGDEQPAAA